VSKATESSDASGKPPCTCTPVKEVDARGLEPPQPLITILEALAQLPEGGQIRAHTDRRPLHLYAHLEERGFTGETKEQEDGSFVTTIRCA
jgi:TusA-related sulfurtransferase